AIHVTVLRTISHLWGGPGVRLFNGFPDTRVPTLFGKQGGTDLTAHDQSTLRESAVRHLQEMIRRDTQSPPGNEIRAAEYIRDALAEAGIESEFMESAPGRVSEIGGASRREPA